VRRDILISMKYTYLAHVWKEVILIEIMIINYLSSNTEKKLNDCF